MFSFLLFEIKTNVSLPTQNTRSTRLPAKTLGIWSSSRTTATRSRLSKEFTRLEKQSNHSSVFCQQVYRSQEDLLSRAKKPINYEVRLKEKDQRFLEIYVLDLIWAFSVRKSFYGRQNINEDSTNFLPASGPWNLCDGHARALRFHRGRAAQKLLLPETFLPSVKVGICLKIIFIG